ncbi:MAG: type VII secretion protein EssC [Coriobacteriia bacterium]|nr:type VII secretion protein EssC [Coriobacteriia bacterium]
MNLTLIRPDRIFVTTLPDEINGRHWVTDIDSKMQQRNLVCIEAVDDRWELSSSGKTAFIDEGEDVRISPEGGLYHLRIDEATDATLLIENPEAIGKEYTKIGFADDTTIRIGSDENVEMFYINRFIDPTHAILTYENECFYITDVSIEGRVYVNGYSIPKGGLYPLEFADRVFIMGLNIIIGKRFIAYNNPYRAVYLKPSHIHIPYLPQTYDPVQAEADNSLESETDFFFRSPRIRRDIVPKNISVEDPPNKEKPEETPTILRVGPSIGMALGSAMMGIYMVSTAISSDNLTRAIPMGFMVIVMILGAVLWPNLTRRYERKKADAAESNRRATYAAYLDKIRTAIADEITHQKEVFEENRISLLDCLRRVNDEDRRLYERTAIQPDFLELRIGRGDAELLTTFTFPADKLSLEEDILKNELADVEARPRIVEDVPLAIALQDDYITGVVAQAEDYYPFMRGLIAQLATLHAPDEVKIVFFGDSNDEAEWSFVKSLPHIFDRGSAFRFLATDTSEAAEVSLRLERELNLRASESKVEHAGDYGAYYVLFVANQDLAYTTDIINSVNALRVNKGFSVITFADELRELPKECSCIIELSGTDGVYYDPKDSSGKQTSFNSDISLDLGIARAFAEKIAGIKLDESASENSLPSSLGFLEMFEVGKVEHLNIKNRWAESNPTRSLGVPLGVDSQGMFSILDAHEDAHGPHGLFAGMTGSGKSETIITYILSLAVNFRPDEVSFVLIDYKGGGLAGAFDNSRARLPHLSGTITNLDGAAISRSLISIQSELKRRQALFNEARDITSAGTMDIYKYQELYRQGTVSEPCTHLFIIADEFAELKSQQPEFMDQLISAARIGRSLGVHLLLATQKPSGVVNDQIWSNARFKICLKVADAADSREMLRRPDAAELTSAGQYYLQVGYNEYFALGQTAYSGATYRPTDYFEKKTDDSVVLISTTGRPVVSVSPPKSQTLDTKTPEAVAILDHLVEVAAAEGLSAPRLWLDPVPEDLTIEHLGTRYPEQFEDQDPYVLSAVIGEYDDPFTQSQHLLRMPLSEEGNALVFGAAGSGKSTLLSSMVYSLIQSYPVYALNVYILDFGAETLGAFRSAPHVGDVVFSGDEEKVVNLIRMLGAEIEQRRKELSSFGGSLELYNKSVEKTVDRLPFILVVINNFDIFPELYEQYFDDLNKLTRDGTRYGIYFVLSCTRSGAVSYRMQPNFKLKFALKLNSNDEYISIFGSVRDIVIPDAYARGLIKQDRVFEFQTALMSADPSISEYEAIVEAVSKLKPSDEQIYAKAIPSLPETVSVDLLTSYGVSREALPLGISKNTFEIQVQNFKRSPVLFVTGDDEDEQAAYLEPLVEIITTIDKARVFILDSDSLLGSAKLAKDDKTTVLQDSRQINDFFNSYFAEGNERSTDDYLLIVSLKSFLDSLDSTARAVFDEFMKNCGYKNLGGLIVTGDPSRFSTFSYETWFRELCSYSNGIWTSSGINNQSFLKINRQLPEFRDPPTESFAWFIDRGNPVLIKHTLP